MNEYALKEARSHYSVTWKSVWNPLWKYDDDCIIIDRRKAKLTIMQSHWSVAQGWEKEWKYSKKEYAYFRKEQRKKKPA